MVYSTPVPLPNIYTLIIDKITYMKDTIIIPYPKLLAHSMFVLSLSSWYTGNKLDWHPKPTRITLMLLTIFISYLGK